VKNEPEEPRKGKLSYVGLLFFVPAAYFAISTGLHQLSGTHELGMRSGEIGSGQGYFYAAVFAVIGLVILFTRDQSKPD
jgi:hypothetical protein